MSSTRLDGMDLSPAIEAVWGTQPGELTLTKLKGDASTRSYYRLQSQRGEPATLVVMRLPSDDPGAAASSELPFIVMQRMLAERAIRVPQILHADRARGVILLEDLGDQTFEARLLASGASEWSRQYEAAVALLARMHGACATGRPDELAFTRGFDRTLLSFELEHFRKWGLEARGIKLSDEERGVFTRSSAWLCDQILEQPFGFTHRDYQSRNLMWHRDELVVIDFQDALQGPVVYDLVALLCDSYVWLDQGRLEQLIAIYARLRGMPEAQLTRAFWQVAVQRKLKDAGRFIFIDQVRGNPDFLRWVVPSLRQVGRALEHLPELSELAALLAAKLPGFPAAPAPPVAQTGARSGASM